MSTAGEIRNPLKVSQITLGRFHQFDLARQLERHGVLEHLITAYPRFKLRNEDGIPKEKIRSFPWIYTPFMARHRVGLHGKRLAREWEWLARETLDTFAAKAAGSADVVIALASCGLRAGRRIKLRGGHFVCDRGSTHIRFQDEIVRDEYVRWGLEPPGIDPRVIAKEEAEYELADRITVPSDFARQTYIERGVPAEKVCKIPLGVRLDRFQPCRRPDPGSFTILYVGGISLRKGFLYLLDAFNKWKHPHKKMIAVGHIDDRLRPLLADRTGDRLTFLSHIPNDKLPALYSGADVCVLPSIEDGFGMTILEAMACGCPVIASKNVGAGELVDEGCNGFQVPIRSVAAIVEALEKLASWPISRENIRASCAKEGGWDVYGGRIYAILREVVGGKDWQRAGSQEVKYLR